MRNKKKFNEFMNKTIEELKDEKRYGTAHVYQSTLNAFCEFCGCKIVYFHQLNRATLKEFETHLRDKQLSWNTVSTYMRTLRGAYNKAVDQKITTGNSRLFNHVYTGVKNDVKRALEVEEINKLLNEVPLKRLPEDLVRCRVWANLMFQLRGMPFVDLAFLHKSDLKGNTLSSHFCEERPDQQKASRAVGTSGLPKPCIVPGLSVVFSEELRSAACLSPPLPAHA